MCKTLNKGRMFRYTLLELKRQESKRNEEESRKDEAKPIDIFSLEDDLFESVNGDNDIQAIPTGNWLEVPLPVLCKEG